MFDLYLSFNNKVLRNWFLIHDNNEPVLQNIVFEFLYFYIGVVITIKMEL